MRNAYAAFVHHGDVPPSRYFWRRNYVNKVLKPAKKMLRRMGIKTNTFTFVQGNNNQSNGTSSSITVSLTGVTAGNLIVTTGKHEGSYSAVLTVSSSIDGSPTGYTTQVDHSNGDLFIRAAYYLSCSGGNHTWTWSWGANRQYRNAQVMELSYSGTCVLDQQNTSQGTNTQPVDTGSITTTGTEEAVFCYVGEYNGYNWDTGYPDINSQNYDNIQTAVWFGSLWWKRFTSTFTGSGGGTVGGDSSCSWAGGIISFKETGGAAAASLLPAPDTLPNVLLPGGF